MLKLLKEPNENVNPKFIVKGYIMGFADTNPHKVIKKLEKETNRVVDLFCKESKNKTYMALYNLVMMV